MAEVEVRKATIQRREKVIETEKRESISHIRKMAKMAV